MRPYLPIAIIAAGAALYACAAHAADPSDWQAWNRQFNQSHPLRNEALPWGAEGLDGYDCQGFVELKVKALYAQGVSFDRMRVLIVSNASGTGAHMVLQVQTASGSLVFDNLSPWLQHRSDYHVLRAWYAQELLASVAVSERNVVSPVIRQIESAR